MHWTLIEGRTYWTVFAGAFLAVAAWESYRPARALSSREERRWGGHAVLGALGFALTGLVYRASPAVVAAGFADSPFGLLNRGSLPTAVRWIVAILVLDLVRYGVHWAFHAVPVLWRVHRVHHSDPDLDASTGARFHPIEMVLTQGAYLAAVAVIAPPVGAAVVSELLFSAQSFLSHANARLPRPIETIVRPLWITPDLHRLHHSIEASDQRRNLGSLFPWWDRAFGTYAAPIDGAPCATPGLAGYQDARSLGLGFMLTLPFGGRLPVSRRP